MAAQKNNLPEPDKSIGVLILAAGASRRMGQPKQLLLWQGESLVRRVTRIALSMDCGPVVVVTGAYAGQVHDSLEGFSVEKVFFPGWEEGMGASLGAGLEAMLQAAPGLHAVLVLLVDQPFVDRVYVQRLIELFRQSGMPIAATAYSDTLGPPVIFSREIFPELFVLKGDKGAKKIIQQHPEQCVNLSFPAGSLDLDTPEDLQMSSIEI